MSDACITSVADFVKDVVALKRRKLSPSPFFRGEAALFTHPCTPSVYRDETRIRRERFFFNEALHRFPEKFSECKTTLERLVLMQHYGIPTRLLDVTENPLVALFFACDENTHGPNVESKNGCVFCIAVPFGCVHYKSNKDVEKFASLSGKGRGFRPDGDDYKKILFVKPPWRNERIKRQQGEMLLFGCGERKKDRVELDDNDSNEIYIKRKWSIPAEGKHEILKELHALGIRKSFLFPDLKNLTEEIDEITRCKGKK